MAKRSETMFFSSVVVVVSALLWPALAETSTRWARLVGGVGTTEHTQTGCATADGGMVFAGYRSTAGASDDLFVFKMDASGNVLWQRSGGSTQSDTALCIYPLNDGGFLLGGSVYTGLINGTDAWLLRFTSSGGLLWQKTYGGLGMDIFRSIAPTNDGGFVCVGETTSDGAVFQDTLCIKIDAGGNVQWAYAYGGGGPDIGLRVEPVQDGGFLVSSYSMSYGMLGDTWVLKLNALGVVAWSLALGGASADLGMAMPTADGGYILSGVTHSYGAGGGDIFLAKLNASRAVTWFKTYGGGGFDSGVARPCSDGGFILRGMESSFDGADEDLWLVKTDGNGTPIWQKSYGAQGADEEIGNAFEMQGGGYVIHGISKMNDPAAEDAFVARVSATGDIDGSCVNLVRSTNATVMNITPTTGVTPVGVIALPIVAVTRSIPGGDVTYPTSSLCTAPDLPDLTGTVTRLSKRGSKATVAFDCQNTGSIGAGRFTVQMYFSKKKTVGRGARAFATKTVSSLAAGRSVSIRGSGVPSRRDKYLVVVVDAANGVIEVDEANNTVNQALP